MLTKSKQVRVGSRRFLPTVFVAFVLVVTTISLSPHSSGATLDTSTATVFAVVGDYGVDNSNEATLKNLVDSWSPNFILTVGDNFYSNALTAGDTGNDYHESVGKYFCAYLKDVAGTDTCPAGAAAVNRFFPALGNHDYGDATPSPGTYTGYFTLPGAGITTSGPSGNERYYDFVQGPVHFFVLNSNTQEPDGTSSTSTQAHWLQTQLAASTSTWNVVLFHHPPYSSDSTHGSTTYMQWPFAQWGADAVLSGHAHDYERIVRDGIVYFVNGLGAAARYSFGTPVAGSEFRYNGQHGAQRVTATDTNLQFEFVSDDGVVQDTYTLTKTASAPTPTPAPTSQPSATQVATETPIAPTSAITVAFQNGVSPSALYAGGDDAYLSQSSTTSNYGSASTCLADGDDPAGTGRDLSCLLRWDISSIPPGSTVTTASITLDVINTSVSSYPVYQVLQPWRDSEATWNVYGAGLPWAVPGALGGADRGTLALGAVDASLTGPRTFNLNAAGIAAVQAWVDAPASNNGVIIADSSLGDGADFISNESGTPSERPKLTVEYVPPAVAQPTATVHAGDLADTSTRTENTWGTQVSITVHDAAHNPVAGAVVSGSWSDDTLVNSASCISGTDGRCSIAHPGLPSSEKSVNFTVSGIALPGSDYDRSANHDPDGDSDGTTIVITG